MGSIPSIQSVDFRLRNARKSLESNLRRLDNSLFQSEEILTDIRTKVKISKELTRAAEGIPVYSPGVRRPLSDFLQPLKETPLSKISREPWWWGYASLRPHMKQLKAKPSHLRDSYLSPVKSTFHWNEHPFRHIAHEKKTT